MLIDSHCHLDRLDLSDHNDSLSNALKYAQQQGVSQFLCIATDQSNFQQVHKIALDHKDVFCTAGLHPLSDDLSVTGMEQFLYDAAKLPKVVGIGETGLDAYYAEKTLKEQQQSFELHLNAAKQTQLPLVVHTRDAKQQTLQLLKQYAGEITGVLHCFTEDWDMASQALDLGFYISISGIVTFKQAENVRTVAKKLPLERLLVETDSPYLAPVPYRGKPCQPAYVRKTAEFLANLRGESLEMLARETTQNFYQLFTRCKNAQSV